jgi:hypothetical protein
LEDRVGQGTLGAAFEVGGAAGDHYNFQVWRGGSKFADQGQAVFGRGKAEIEDYGFRARGGELLARDGGAAGGGHSMAVMFEYTLAKIQSVCVVIDEKDAGH